MSPDTCLGDGSPYFGASFDGRPFERMSEDDNGFAAEGEGLDADEDEEEEEEEDEEVLDRAF